MRTLFICNIYNIYIYIILFMYIYIHIHIYIYVMLFYDRRCIYVQF